MTVQHHGLPGPPGQEAQAPLPPPPSGHLKNKSSSEDVFMFILTFLLPFQGQLGQLLGRACGQSL